jgi:hypothetical protein
MSKPKIVFIPEAAENQWKAQGEALVNELGGTVFDLFAPIPRGSLPTSGELIFDNNEVVISSISKGTSEEDELIAEIVEQSFREKP